ncbi:unnamed protein product [Choristocarpus tenellus]
MHFKLEATGRWAIRGLLYSRDASPRPPFFVGLSWVRGIAAVCALQRNYRALRGHCSTASIQLVNSFWRAIFYMNDNCYFYRGHCDFLVLTFSLTHLQNVSRHNSINDVMHLLLSSLA